LLREHLINFHVLITPSGTATADAPDARRCALAARAPACLEVNHHRLRA
jgi:hypothetical protein